MIKCPKCGKRLAGQDLVTGVCSHCNQALSGGDSSFEFQQAGSLPSAMFKTGSDGSGSDSDGSAGRGSGSEQTFISDEFASPVVEQQKADRAGMGSGSEQTFISDEFTSPVSPDNFSDRSGAGSGSAQTFISDEFDSPVAEKDTAVQPKSGAGSEQTLVSDEFDAPDTRVLSRRPSDGSDSAQTFISDEFDSGLVGSPSPFARGQSGADDPNRSDQTMISDDFASSGSSDDCGMGTAVSEPAGNRADCERTFVMDALPADTNRIDDESKTINLDASDDAMMKTVESVWGGEAEQAEARPHMTMKAREHRQSAKAKQTLVIKTKTLSDVQPGAALGATDVEPEYELLKVLGEGGMGVVYDARQTSIDRNVAVKMLKAATASNDKQRAKFLAEAVVTGDLDHPNIVPIYDVGSNNQGALFYSMKKVQGTPWLKVITQKSTTENVEILMKVADAVGFAHARGVVHRDLKPENVMLGEYGEVLVMDWGLAQPAKTFRKARSITESTSMGGTPAYMAPEMATGPIDKICPASDVYLLGAILYEIVTGGPPHVAKSAMKCLMAAARNEIAPTDKQGELLDIAMKAMATDVKDRYQDTKSFQAAIREYQSHSESTLLSTRGDEDLTEARSTNDYQQFARALFAFQEAHELWAGNKRAKTGISETKLAYADSAKIKGDLDLGLSLLDDADPAHASLRKELHDLQAERTAKQKRLVMLKKMATGLAAAVFFIVAGASVWIRSEQQKAVAEATRATKAETLAVAEKNRATKAEAEALVQRDIAQEERDKATKAAKKEELAKNDAIEAQKIAETERMKADQQRKVAEEQRMVAVAERTKAEMAKEKEEKAKLAAIESQKQEEQAKLAAIKSEETAVAERKKAVEAKEKEEYEAYISKIGLAASQIDKNAFDAARTVLESCSPKMRHWEWGRLMHLCSQSSRAFTAESPLDSMTPDAKGERFATGGWDGTARVWDLSTGKVLQTMKHAGEYVHAVAFSPDGRLLATGSNEPGQFVQIWDIATGKLIKAMKGHEDAVLSVTFSRDGSRLLTSSYDKTVRLWDVSSGKEQRAFRGHTWWVWTTAFSPDETRIVTAGQDGTAIVWDINSDKRTSPFTGHRGPIYSAVFSPDGQSVVTAGFDRRILVWNPDDVKSYNFKGLEQGEVIPPAKYRACEGHADAVRSVRLSSDGKLIVSGSQDNTVRVWDFESGQLVKSFRGHGGRVQAATFLNDGKRLLSAAHDNTIREWSIGGNEEIRTLQGRVLLGHADSILAAAYSHDQRQIVTASRDRTARTWNVHSGESAMTFEEGHSYLASSAEFFPDGRRLLTAAVDNTARIWDVQSGGQRLRLDRTGRSATVALSHDSKRVATGSDDKTVQLWDASTGERLKKLEGHLADVTAVAFSPDDRLLVSGDFKGRVKVWNIVEGREVAKLDGHTRKIAGIVFSSDGTRIFTASADKTVGQWNASTGEELPKLILKHPDSLLAIKVVPGGNLVATSCADGRVRIWDGSKAEVIQTIGPFEGEVSSISVSSDGKRLIAANSEDRTVRLFEVETGREVQSTLPGGKQGPLVDLKRHGGILWSTAFLPGSDDVLTVGGSDARLWDAKSGEERMSFSPHAIVASARFSPDGTLVVTGSWDNSAKIWEAKSGKVVRKLEGGHDGAVNTALFSPDGQRVLTASDDGTAKLWDVATGSVIKSLAGHKDRVRSASFSVDGRWIVTASADRTARLWNAETGESVREFSGHIWGLVCAEFSRDGRMIVTGSEDNTARVWDVESGRSLNELSGHTASITSVAFSPDATRVLTGSQDQAAKLWDALTGKEILTLSRHTEDVTSVSFSPDGRQVLTASRDGTAVIWLSQVWQVAKTADAAIPTNVEQNAVISR